MNPLSNINPAVLSLAGRGARVGAGVYGGLSGATKKLLLGGAITGVGLGVGALAGDEESSNARFQNVMAGGMAGLGVGAAAMAPGLVAKGLWKGGTALASTPYHMAYAGVLGEGGERGAWSGAKALYRGYVRAPARAVKGAYKMTKGVLGWMNRHPLLSLGLGAGAYMGISEMTSGNSGPNLSDDEMSELAMSRGASSTDSREMLQDSTVGLTQGLHRRRHG